jgi:DMSO reductase anchor subunit
MAGPLALYFMQRIYRIKARPFWNHWQVLSSFFGSMLSLGPLLAALVFVPLLLVLGLDFALLVRTLALPMLAGLLLEGFGLYRHAAHLNTGGGEGQAAHHEQLSSFGRTYRARNSALALSAGLLLLTMLLPLNDSGVLVLWTMLSVLLVTTALVGRALFYVLVIPTTMPGAFFWKNPGFQGHARDTGLAAMPQVGVQVATH